MLEVLAAEPHQFKGKEQLVREVLETKAIGRTEVRHIERLARSLRRKLAKSKRSLVFDTLGLGWHLLPADTAPSSKARVATGA